MPQLPPMLCRSLAVTMPYRAEVTTLGYLRALAISLPSWLAPRLIPMAYAAFVGWVVLTLGGAL